MTEGEERTTWMDAIFNPALPASSILWTPPLLVPGLVFTATRITAMIHGITELWFPIIGVLSGVASMVLGSYIYRQARSPRAFREASREGRVLGIPLVISLLFLDVYSWTHWTDEQNVVAAYATDVFSSAAALVYASGLFIGLLDLRADQMLETPDSQQVG